MKIHVNDHAGHPFQVQLSRKFAQRGHEVLHTYCSSVLQPRGHMNRKDQDPENFAIVPVGLPREFNRYGLFSRWQQEKELGQALVGESVAFGPDVIISANTPLRAQKALLETCRKNHTKFVFWLQDALGIGIDKALRKRLSVAGSTVGMFFKSYERSLWRKSDTVILITEDFLPYMPQSLIRADRVRVIENWSPLDELPRMPKANPWSRAHGLDNKFCLLYSGTLGLKHNPNLLVRMAEHLKDREYIRVVVITEGLGADFLREAKDKNGLDNLILMGFQPYEDLPNVLATADILLAILERDAGVFAVPSKVLTYLCAERPLLLAVPPENLAARIVSDNRAGIVVPPSEESAYVKAAMTLVENEELRNSCASNGREYAQRTFDIEKIADRFEEIIHN